MLGELVKQEIIMLEHEKQCRCGTCMVNGAVRVINVYQAQNHCECPVCSLTRQMLVEQAVKLQALLDDHRSLHDKINREASSPLLVPQDQDQLAFAIEQQGAIAALSMALAGTVKRFVALCEAAHEAYEIVETRTGEAKIAVLTRDGVQHTNRTLDELIDIAQSRTRNSNDVN